MTTSPIDTKETGEAGSELDTAMVSFSPAAVGVAVGPPAGPAVEMDNFGLYLRDISRIPMLDADEERTVARRAQSGDPAALKLLVESNLRFVVAMARRYSPSGYPFEELVNEGNLGLVEAARRFDPDRGVRFVSYAGWWVRQAILSAIARFGQSFSVPPKLKFEQYQVQKRVRDLAQDLSRQPTTGEIALALEMEEAHVRAVLHAIPGEISLNEPIGDAGFDIEDTMADPRATHVDDALMAQSFRRLLAMSLAQLSPRERYVVERRFGLRGRGDIRPGEAGPFHGSVPHDEFLPSTLAEIGTELDLSRERVRQIEARALGKLRQSDRAHQLRLFLGVNLN